MFKNKSAQKAVRARLDGRRRKAVSESEDVFRQRSCQLLRRKAASVPMSEIELYTPEADPSQLYHQFLETISGESSDFSRFSALLDEVSKSLGDTLQIKQFVRFQLGESFAQ